MKRGLLLLIGVFFLLGLVKADDWFLLHTVRKGESLAAIAKAYYGETWKENYLRLANRQVLAKPLEPGNQLRIPTTVEHTVAEGDTYAKLAASYFKRADLATLLVWTNPQHKGQMPKVGATVRIPHILRYNVKPSDTLEGVAQLLYQDRGMASVIKGWNKLTKLSLTEPLRNVKVIWFALREGAMAPVPLASETTTEREAVEQSAEPSFDAGAMTLVKELIHAGKFQEALTLLKKMPLPKSTPQLGEYHWQVMICHLANGNESKAGEALKSYLATGVDSMQSLLDKGEQLSPKIRYLILAITAE